MPALPTYLIEPIWEQFVALLPERKVEHPLGCHRSRIPDRVIFSRSWFRSWSSAAPTGESPTAHVRLPRCAVGETSG